MLNAIIESIRARSREDWQSLFRTRLEELRTYVQTHGEKAALIGFLLGIFIVIFYKLVLVLACLMIVAYQLVLIISESEGKK
jgi:hypothetical protein